MSSNIKSLKGHIKLRADTLENWTNSKIIPLENELCLVYCGEGFTKFKVGDGTNKFSELKYTDECKIVTQYIESDKINQGYTSSNTVSNYSTVNGVYSDANGNFSEAHGVQASAEDDYSFVWSGKAQDELTERYTSKGTGTIAFNPQGGIEGFYIGDQNLQELIQTQSDCIKNSEHKIDADGKYYCSSEYTLQIISNRSRRSKNNPYTPINSPDVTFYGTEDFDPTPQQLESEIEKDNIYAAKCWEDTDKFEQDCGEKLEEILNHDSEVPLPEEYDDPEDFKHDFNIWKNEMDSLKSQLSNMIDDWNSKYGRNYRPLKRSTNDEYEDYVEETRTFIKFYSNQFKIFKDNVHQNRFFELLNDTYVSNYNFGSITLNNGDIIDNIRFADLTVDSGLICDYYTLSTDTKEYDCENRITLNYNSYESESSETVTYKQTDNVALFSQVIDNEKFDSFQNRLVTIETKGKKINNAVTELYQNVIDLFAKCLYIKDTTALTRYSRYDLSKQSDIIAAYQQLSTDYLLKIKVTTITDVMLVITTLCDQYDVSLENIQLNGNNNTIINVAEPVNNTDAANKKYVDDKINDIMEIINLLLQQKL